MHECMIMFKFGENMVGLKFKVEESRVDTTSGESRALGYNSNRVLKKVPKLQPLRRISRCHETTLAPWLSVEGLTWV